MPLCIPSLWPPQPFCYFVTPTLKVYLQTLQRIEGGSGSKMFQFIEFQLLMRTFEEQYKFKILNYKL